MGAIRLLAAPIRRIARSRLFQFAAVVAIILLLDHYAYDYAALHAVADGLKNIVTATVQLCSDFFRVGILTDPVLQVALMIAYVYVVCRAAALRHSKGRRPRRQEQLSLVAHQHRARARHRCLSRLGTP